VPEPASILVCRLSSLGDVVLSLPVVTALRSAYPRAHLAFLSREPYGRVLSGSPEIDALHVWGGPGTPIPEGVSRQRWDLTVDLSGTGRSRRLLSGIRSGRLLRSGKETLRRFLFVRFRRWGAGGIAISPAVDRLFSALSPLGLGRAGRVPRFSGVERDPEGPVLLAPGGGRPAKCWPADRFAQLAAALVDRGDELLLLGSESERELLETVARDLPAEAVKVVAGPDPADLPAIAAGCSVALTNDSGLLHVAEAAGLPVVAIFGPTHPRLGFAPLGPRSRLLHSALPCSPCDLHGPESCPKGHHGCMDDISVKAVLAVLLPLVRRDGS
jgi:heptosyltransferase-2